MKVLLVYPEYPLTFWSFKHALPFLGKKACLPPLGLMTVAALLPSEWEKRLIDLNVQPITDTDISWADYVFISAMSIQRDSALDVIARCRSLGVKTVAGGPLFTSSHDDFPQVDHLVLNEAEITLPPFLRDLARGKVERIYSSSRRPVLSESPLPLWDLVDLRQYASVNIQYSRGCPFDCEFCDITELFGRKPRTKTLWQVLAELDALYDRGWRGTVFFVDDNFIGDKRKLKSEILPAIINWMEERGNPFIFYTEASIDLSDDPELVQLMVKAGFHEVFIGIETPHQESLQETNKFHNKERDLISCVRKLQQAGLQVNAGFIVGFDSDPPSIFERLIGFIQESGITTAMVGVLIALRGTKLYRRLIDEGRLLGDTSGDNMNVSLNFVPKMNRDALIRGYGKVIKTIYDPRNYYARATRFLKEYRNRGGGVPIDRRRIEAFIKSLFFLGVLGKERFHYWRLLVWSLVHRPRLFPLAINLAINGFHFRKIAERVTNGIGGEEGVP